MKHKRFVSRLLDMGYRGKRKWITLCIILLVILGVGISYHIISDKTVSRVGLESTRENVIEEKRVASALSGLLVPENLANRNVTGVMIENSPNARPQSSLDQAGVVFEAVAEGGITRFLALYQENQPEVIGPIRSLRPYFLDWALGFDAAIAHVGGSAEALELVRSLGTKDLDQFAAGSTYYRSSDRFAPHNVYTSIGSLDALEAARGYGSSEFTPYTRKNDAPLPTPKASSITVPFSTKLYEAQFTYSQTRNSYVRTQAGDPHIDAETSKQLEPKVVVVLSMPTSIKTSGHASMQTIGSGDVLIFQDGDVIEGTWHKSSREGQIVLRDTTKTPIRLNAGQTWFAVLASSKQASYE